MRSHLLRSSWWIVLLALGSCEPAGAPQVATHSLPRQLLALGELPIQVGAIKADQLWPVTRGAGVKVIIIDAGLQISHPDLAAIPVSRRILCLGATLPGGSDHGTAVTSVLAALENQLGIVGVAPEATVYIAPVENSNGSDNLKAQRAACALRFAADNGIRVATMSLQLHDLTGAVRDSLEMAVDYARSHGMLVVAAAGNVPNCKQGFPCTLTAPADMPGAFTVAGVNSDLSWYSNGLTGPQVAVAAIANPVCVDSDSISSHAGSPCGAAVPSGAFDPGYVDGTSFAAPAVAGAAVLLFAAKPSASVSDVMTALTSTAQRAGSQTSAQVGAGLIDVLAAYNALVEPPPPPTRTITVAGSGAGSGVVTGSLSGISCTLTAGVASGTCTANLAHTSGETLHATPLNGATYTWGGLCSGTGDCVLPASTTNQNVTISFTAAAGRMLSIVGAGAGTGLVSGSATGISCTSTGGSLSGICGVALSNSATEILSAIPSNGSTFSGWSGACAGTGPCAIPASSASQTVTATFTPVSGGSFIRVLISGLGGGTVKSTAPAGLNIFCVGTNGSVTGTCSSTAGAGAGVTLTQTNGSGLFGGWSGTACSGYDLCSFTTTGALVKIFADFEPGAFGAAGCQLNPAKPTIQIRYTLAWSLGGSGTVDIANNTSNTPGSIIATSQPISGSFTTAYYSRSGLIYHWIRVVSGGVSGPWLAATTNPLNPVSGCQL